ncbi:MAG: hypothetical protein J0H94_21065 [Rhizobiales bacterium]|nr:hypothetical protein [Hyphomicrobiales bacterium]MBN9489971.1 hypothetical protein [Alphaproteobacteria bacterium]
MKNASYQTYRLDWRELEIEIRYCPDWSGAFRKSCGEAVAHLEIESLCRSPLPMTGTGYRSHFVGARLVDEAGGPLAFAEAWLEQEAGTPDWKSGEAARRQMSLF